MVDAPQFCSSLSKLLTQARPAPHLETQKLKSKLAKETRDCIVENRETNILKGILIGLVILYKLPDDAKPCSKKADDLNNIFTLWESITSDREFILSENGKFLNEIYQELEHNKEKEHVKAHEDTENILISKEKHTKSLTSKVKKTIKEEFKYIFSGETNPTEDDWKNEISNALDKIISINTDFKLSEYFSLKRAWMTVLYYIKSLINIIFSFFLYDPYIYKIEKPISKKEELKNKISTQIEALFI